MSTLSGSYSKRCCESWVKEAPTMSAWWWKHVSGLWLRFGNDQNGWPCRAEYDWLSSLE